MDRFQSNILIFFLVILGCLLPIQISHAADPDDRGNGVSFLWSFNAMAGPDYDRRLIPMTRYNTLKKGDLLKIRLELKKRCFIYFFYCIPEDHLTLLFPSSFNLFDTDYETGKNYDIPPGGTCFRLDTNAGTDTFYLVGSAKRLNNLELSYLKYEAASGHKKQALFRKILSEISDIKGRYSQLIASAERPIFIGGNVRGLLEEKTDHALTQPRKIEVSAPNVYIKTFTINHQ